MKFENKTMIERLIHVIEQQIPVDIYFRIAIDNQPVRCLLYYPAFMVTEINIDRNTFSGYTIQMRNRPINERIFTEDNIALICNIYSPFIEL